MLFLHSLNAKSILIRYAKQVLFGHEVMIEISNVLIPTEVIDVSNFMMQGKHLPHIFFRLHSRCYSTKIFNNCSFLFI